MRGIWMSPPRGPEGPAGSGTIPHAFVHVAYALTGAWADVPGATCTVTIGANGYIVATCALSWSATPPGTEADFRLVINGVNGDATHDDAKGVTEALALILRSGALVAGAYVVKLQARRTAGADGTVAHVDLFAQGLLSE